MFKRILWATDGSEGADLALPLVRELAIEHGAQVVVFHGDIRMVGAHSFGLPAHADEGALKDKIRRQAGELRTSGLEVSVDIVPANTISGAAHDIADAAKRTDADVIVIGSRGHTPIRGLVVGSVTQRLLHLASCPVLVVPVAVEAAAVAPAAAVESAGA
jgi:nucleotide-binding universal stress UspA family protein